MNIANTFFRRLSYVPGWHTKRRIVVFESDDWGSQRTADTASMKRLSERYPGSFRDPFNRLDSLESDGDMETLFEVLDSVNDVNGHPAVFTANTVMANPDFRRIEESDFRSYAYEPFTTTLERFPGREKVRTLISQGMSQNVYHPQFHGREHVNVNQWMRGLQNGNSELRMAFNFGMSGMNLSSSQSMRENLTPAFDFDSAEEMEQHKEILRDGLAMFEEEFGYRSESFIAPSYIWHPALHPAMKSMGIKFLQGLAFQFIPDPGNSFYKRKFRYTGKKCSSGIVHLTRNAFFEPSLHRGADTVGTCLKRIEEAFAYRKPAIIGTHRVNYVGSIEEENRTENIRLLRILLNSITKKWPDIEFLTTDQLGRIMAPKSSRT